MEEKKEEKWIYASTMLDDLDVRYDRYGRKRMFSMKFVTASGKIHFFPLCFAQGAGRMDNKQYRLRGIQPCDCKGNPEFHPFPVKIFNILEYNNQKIDWSNGYTVQQ